MSSDPQIAVRVRGLGKSYSIAHQDEKHSTLAESLLAKVRRPLTRIPRETFWALKDVNFDINKGDVVGIIGRNGAGKSTLLKILSRITEPTEGQIDLYGRVASLLEVGTGFHPELTGRENVFLNGAILGMTKAEIRRQFDAIIDFAGIEKFLDTPVKRYSSGMYVRLAFAVAAHLNPEILIVDEVLAVGDQAFQNKCLGKMKDVASSGRTILYVSHSMSTVLSLCTRAMLLQQGRVVSAGAVRPTVDRYMEQDVANPERGLADAKLRPGTGEIRFTSVLPAKNKYLGQEPKAFQFRVERAGEHPGPFTLSAHVRNEAGTIIVQCDSRLTDTRFADLSGRTGTLTISTPTLKPGRYWLDVGILSGTLIDLFYDACSFNVDPELPYGKVAPPEAYQYGTVFGEFTWQVN